MKHIHSFGLQDAEEDFIALMPINACFLLVVLFPEVNHYWRLSQLDTAMSETQKSQILKFYYRIVQKHQFYHGDDLRYLCKNPSFLMWVQGLAQQFPDARFIICEREPAQVVPSQISSLQPMWTLIYGHTMPAEVEQKFVAMLAAYYHYLERIPLSDINAMRLPMHELVNDLESIIRRVQRHTHLPTTKAFEQALTSDVQASKKYRSQHVYAEPSRWSSIAARFPKKYQYSLSEGC